MALSWWFCLILQCFSLAASPTSHAVFVGSASGYLYILDFNNPEVPRLVNRIHMHTGPIKHIVWVVWRSNTLLHTVVAVITYWYFSFISLHAERPKMVVSSWQLPTMETSLLLMVVPVRISMCWDLLVSHLCTEVSHLIPSAIHHDLLSLFMQPWKETFRLCHIILMRERSTSKWLSQPIQHPRKILLPQNWPTSTSPLTWLKVRWKQSANSLPHLLDVMLICCPLCRCEDQAC